MQQHVSKYFTRRPPTHPPPPRPWRWGQDVKIPLFQNMVMLHITLKGMGHRAPCKHIFCPYKHTFKLWVGLKGKKLLNVVSLHIKIRGKRHRLT